MNKLLRDHPWTDIRLNEGGFPLSIQIQWGMCVKDMYSSDCSILNTDAMYSFLFGMNSAEMGIR
jgi:hypothetical protein